MDASVAARKRARRPLVLVVEDEALIRIVMADWLRDSGMECLEAADADEAVQILRSHDNIDLVFSDVRMPGQMDGLGLAQWLRRERPKVPVVLTSANPLPGSAAVDAALPFFRKPYDLCAVVARIRELTDRLPAMQRAAAR
jgi:CheY-like chemotaxis protein